MKQENETYQDKKNKALMQIISENEKGYNFNPVTDCIHQKDLSDIEDEDDLTAFFEELDENGYITDANIIYYSNAVEYLKENDPALVKSLALAKEYGYTDLDQIDSELLANLHAQDNNRDEYADFIEEVKNDFAEWLEENPEPEEGEGEIEPNDE